VTSKNFKLFFAGRTRQTNFAPAFNLSRSI
jgi:hypothetical protein